jgi:hypothetical protein
VQTLRLPAARSKLEGAGTIADRGSRRGRLRPVPAPTELLLGDVDDLTHSEAIRVLELVDGQDIFCADAIMLRDRS